MTRRAVIFPIFHEPVHGEPGADGQFDLTKMTPEHLELFAACYRNNFKWVPRLFWDNQRAGGVSLAGRMLAQTFGRAQVFYWRSVLWRLRDQVSRRSAAPGRVVS